MQLTCLIFQVDWTPIIPLCCMCSCTLCCMCSCTCQMHKSTPQAVTYVWCTPITLMPWLGRARLLQFSRSACFTSDMRCFTALVSCILERTFHNKAQQFYIAHYPAASLDHLCICQHSCCSNKTCCQKLRICIVKPQCALISICVSCVSGSFCRFVISSLARQQLTQPKTRCDILDL